jgi:ribonuclease HII
MKLEYELAAFSRGYRALAGMDEVGRGPLAGPVAAACVMLPLDTGEGIAGVTDSKKLSPRRRAALAAQILERADCWSLGMVEAGEIDRINILQATRRAMEQAVLTMEHPPDLVLVDAVRDLKLPMAQQAIVKGDLYSYLIGAASIVAKEARDRIMRQYDQIYPGYGFARHMGYGTAEHILALRRLGPCPIHRRSFITKILGGTP